MKVETDIALIKQSLQRIEKFIDEHEKKEESNETRITILEQKSGVMAGVQGAFTVLVGAISAYFGTRQ